jgi:hypothetical protein
MDTSVSLPTKPVTKHCTYVYTGDITLHDMEGYVISILEHVQREIVLRNPNYVSNCVVEVNMPLLNAYKPQELDKGYAFVWVSRQEVFNMLIGKNYDGGESIPQLEFSSPIELLKNPLSWGDSEHIPNLTYEIPTYTDAVGQDRKMFFTPADVNRVSYNDYEEGKLFCLTNLDPKRFRSEDIIRIFSMFTTLDSKLTVISNNRGHYYINFENPDDVYFALCMRKKYKDPATGLLIEFDHAIKKQTPSKSRGNRSTHAKKRFY